MLMTATSTRTHSRTRLAVERPVGGGRVAVTVETSGPPDRPVIRPMVLGADARGAHVSLVPDGALLLAGDAVRVDIRVGPGARLDLVEPGGTVAYAMAGASASWSVDITLAPAAALTWAGEPFVVADGACVDRRMSIRIGWGATLAIRESIVLGRQGERAGRLRQRVEVSDESGVPVLLECLDVGPDSSRLLLGDGRVIGTVLQVGRRLRPTASRPNWTWFDLEANGTLARAVAAEAHELGMEHVWNLAG